MSAIGELHINVLTVSREAAPTDPIPFFVNDLSFPVTYFYIKTAVIRVDAMLYFGPLKDFNGLVIDIYGFTFIDHINP